MNKKKIAKVAQVNPEQVRVIKMNLNRLKEQGALVAIHCYGLSIIERRATNAERGVADDDMRARRISSGRVKTLPAELCGKLLTLRELSRSRLDDPFTSFNITGFKPWRYIPVKKFASWLQSQQELEEEWDKVKAECAASLSAFKKDETERCTVLAQRSWNSLWANASKKAKEVVKVDGKQYTRGMFDVFEARVVEHALACIPTAKHIDTMQLSWEVGGVETGGSIARDMAEEAKAQEEAAEAEAHTAELTEETRQMKRIVSERIKEQLSSLPDPGVEMIQQLRGAVGETARNVRQSLEEKGRFYKGTSNALANLTQKFEEVNPGDDELEQLIARLRASLYRTSEGYNYDAIRGSLESIEFLCNKQYAKDARMDRAAMVIAALE